MNVSMSLSYHGGAPGLPPPPPVETRQLSASPFNILTDIDKDRNGLLSASEVGNSPLSLFINQNNWEQVDTNADGALAFDELVQHGKRVIDQAHDAPSRADAGALFEGLANLAAPAINHASQETAGGFYEVAKSIFGALAG